MAGSFFFYDLETTGLDARNARVMQFAGQRTDMNLEPVGEPFNILIKITPDVLPSPDAIMVTGITPQQTLAEGITEAEFLKIFHDDIVQPGTIFTGFNTVRFDDEFMRFMHWRNFYDPYEWAWANDCSRWDILDLVRMTRALRPKGIEWPFTPEGKATNRLELLTKLNGLDHEKAHDALNDVYATIAVAKLIKDKQPDLFSYLLDVRDKKSAAKVVEAGQPFVYTTGRYSGDNLNTSVSIQLAKHPQPGAALVYDLRHDPTPFFKMSIDELVQAWRYNPDPEAARLPVKTLKYNRCPAVAPLGVLKDKAAQNNIGLSLEAVAKNLEILKAGHKEFAAKVLQALKKLDAERENAKPGVQPPADARLYENFISDHDKQVSRVLRVTKPEEISDVAADIRDERLKTLAPLYKARNFPGSLTEEERQTWDEYCKEQLFAGGNQSKLAKYFARLQELAAGDVSSEKQFLLEELQLYGQSIMPVDGAD